MSVTIQYDYNYTQKVNGNFISPIGPVLTAAGQTITIESGPVRNNYIFLYWNTKSDGTGNTYYSGDIVSEDLTLYAIWEPITYLTTKTTLTSIANVIRASNGESSSYAFPEGFVSGISKTTSNNQFIKYLNKNLRVIDLTNFKSSEIPSCAFYSQTIASSILGGNNIETINAYAFYHCSSLITIDFPECITIGSSAFESCINLATINFPSCTIINTWAFAGCQNFITASFPACEEIGGYAFYNCYYITTASFPLCEKIGSHAFLQCVNLNTVNFPVCSIISQYAFSSCRKLTAIDFPECLSIGSYAFNSCISLTTMSFPKCSIIGSNAFEQCTSLPIASFPLCEEIGAYAFNNCTALSTISFPKCETIGTSAFYGCTNSSFKTISLPLCYLIHDHAFTSTPITTLSLPSCTKINSYAFANCVNINTTVSLPACTVLSSGAFQSCTNLKQVRLREGMRIAPSVFQSTSLSLLYLGNSEAVCTLDNINAFDGTPLANGTGTIYVRSALLASYKTATNWVALSGRFKSSTTGF